MMEYNIDEWKLCFDEDIEINKHLKIHFPKIKEIRNLQIEENYFSIVSYFCTMPNDMAYPLNEQGIDFTTISDYELFIYHIAPTLTNDKTKAMFGNDVDFSKMKLEKVNNSDDFFLKQEIITVKEIPYKTCKIKSYVNNLRNKPIKTIRKEEKYDIIFDKLAYKQVLSYISYVHDVKLNNDIPGNEGAKRYIIHKSRKQYKQQKKDYKSQIINLIFAMINHSDFKYNKNDVLEMGIYPFMKSVKVILKHENATLLKQSGYSGFGVNLKDIDQKEIDWINSE